MKHFLYCLALFFATVVNDAFARDWLQPLPIDRNEPFILESFRFVPYRFLYKGFSGERTNMRYLLKAEDGRIVSLHLGETFDSIALLDADPSHKTITIRDDRLPQTLTLKLGKETLLPNRFEGTFLYQNKRYYFSEQPLRLDEQTQITPMLHEGHVYLLQQTEGKEPCVFELHKP